MRLAKVKKCLFPSPILASEECVRIEQRRITERTKNTPFRSLLRKIGAEAAVAVSAAAVSAAV